MTQTKAVPPTALAAAGPAPGLFDGQRRRDDSYPSWSGAASIPALGRWLEAAPPVLVSAAEWRWEEGRRVERRRLPTAIIGWHYAGRGEAIVAGERIAIEPGTLLCIPSGTWHEVRHHPGQPLRSVGLHCQMPLLGTRVELMDLIGIPRAVTLHRGVDEVVAEALRGLPRLMTHKPPGWEQFGRAEIVRIVMHLVLHHGRSFRPIPPAIAVPDVRLAAVLARIERELADGPLPVADLAVGVGLSGVHLRTLFRRATGLSPHRYIQLRRIDFACRLLRQTDSSVAQVAEASGVGDVHVFHRLFRQHTGTTPQRWRRDP